MGSTSSIVISVLQFTLIATFSIDVKPTILRNQTSGNAIILTGSLHKPRDEVSLLRCGRQSLLVPRPLQAGWLRLRGDLQEEFRQPRVSRERGALLQGDEEITFRWSVFQDHEEVSGAASGSGRNVLESHEKIPGVFRKWSNISETLSRLSGRAASLVRTRSGHKPSTVPLQS